MAPVLSRLLASGPLARLVLGAPVVAVLALIPMRWLEAAPSICLFRNLLGVRCPGCGMTRAFSALLHADLHSALAYNKLVFVVFPLVCGLLVHDAAVVIWARRDRGTPSSDLL